MIVFFMIVLLAWLFLIDMLFNPFSFLISPLCLLQWSGGSATGLRLAASTRHSNAVLSWPDRLTSHAAKMDRERELKIIRRAYGKQVTAAAGVGDPQVEAAFAAVAREDFLGPAPGTSCADAAPRVDAARI
jgi:hypothetical protein